MPRFRLFALCAAVLAGLLLRPAYADVVVPFVQLVAGSAAGERGTADGIGTNARFNTPLAISLSADGTVALVADAQNNLVRRFVVASGEVSTLAGAAGQRGFADGTGSAALFAYPSGVALSADGSFALVADTDNHTIRRIDVASGAVTTLAGAASQRGSADGTGTVARFSYPASVALSADGSFALVADTDNHTIRRIDVASGAVTTLAGQAGQTGSADGAGGTATFNAPAGVALSADDSFALVADTDNHTIRRIDVASGAVTTLAGQVGQTGSADGAGLEALFNFPRGIAITHDGTALIADFSNSTLRQLTIANGTVSTVAGSALVPGLNDGLGTAARLRFPAGVAVANSTIVIADTYNHALRVLSPKALQTRAFLPMIDR